MTNSEIVIEILAVDEMIKEMDDIALKAQMSSPSSKALFSNGASPSGFYLPSKEEQDRWRASKDGIAFTNAVENSKRLSEYKISLLAQVKDNIKTKIELK